jgi:hypothetical protein
MDHYGPIGDNAARSLMAGRIHRRSDVGARAVATCHRCWTVYFLSSRCPPESH